MTGQLTLSLSCCLCYNRMSFSSPPAHMYAEPSYSTNTYDVYAVGRALLWALTVVSVITWALLSVNLYSRAESIYQRKQMVKLVIPGGQTCYEEVKASSRRVTNTHDPSLSLNNPLKWLCWPFLGHMPTPEPISVFLGMVRNNSLVRLSHMLLLLEYWAWPIAPWESWEEGQVLVCDGMMQGVWKSDSGPLLKVSAGNQEASCLSRRSDSYCAHL